MRRFFINKKASLSERLTITGPDVKHIRTVLRLKPGDTIALLDGQGTEYLARINTCAAQAVTVTILDRHVSAAEPCEDMAIGLAMLKARKMDRVVRQLTELGATALLPFFAERSVTRPDPPRLIKRVKRWEVIAKEALKQCGRSRLPEIGPVVSFEKLLKASRSYDHRWIFHAGMVDVAIQQTRPGAPVKGSVVALIGPEGGFSDQEMDLAMHHGFACRSLGPTTLKADTAAIAAAVVLIHEFGCPLWRGNLTREKPLDMGEPFL